MHERREYSVFIYGVYDAHVRHCSPTSWHGKHVQYISLGTSRHPFYMLGTSNREVYQMS